MVNEYAAKMIVCDSVKVGGERHATVKQRKPTNNNTKTKNERNSTRWFIFKALQEYLFSMYDLLHKPSVALYVH